MTGGIRVARILGFDISIHPSWFIILALVVWSLAAGTLPALYADWSQATYWMVAVVAALLLFASVLVHELAHSVVARRQGTPVAGITLFLLGGVASLEREATSPGREAVMAGVGPLTSLVLGGAFWGIGQTISGPEVVRAVLLYLGLINAMLAAFNLLPAFPLDGGRVFRAALWSWKRDYLAATRIATRVTLVIGSGFIAYAAFSFLWTGLLGGLWIGFIGFMLMQTARGSYRQTLVQQRLDGVPVTRVMTTPATWVAPGTSLRRAGERLADAEIPCLPVGQADEGLAGVVCLTDLERPLPDGVGSVSPARRAVADVMTTTEHMPIVSPHDSAAEALRRMTGAQSDRAAVLDGRALVGMVDRGTLLRYLRETSQREDASSSRDSHRETQRRAA